MSPGATLHEAPQIVMLSTSPRAYGYTSTMPAQHLTPPICSVVLSPPHHRYEERY